MVKHRPSFAKRSEKVGKVSLEKELNEFVEPFLNGYGNRTLIFVNFTLKCL